MSRENIRQEITFGHGSFTKALSQEPDFHEWSWKEVAEATGWAVGCPVVQELIDPKGERGGPEVMAKRYGEVGLWFSYMKHLAQDINPLLVGTFEFGQFRYGNEPVGHFEPESVPDDYSQIIPPTETLVGYSLTRLFIEQLGSDEDLADSERAERLDAGLEMLETTMTSGVVSGAAFLARLAEAIRVQGDVSPEVILKRTISAGWLKLQNGAYQVETLKEEVEQFSPELWGLYQNMSKKEKARLGIA